MEFLGFKIARYSDKKKTYVDPGILFDIETERKQKLSLLEMQ